MAKINNGRYDNNKDMPTGRPSKNPQMTALKKAHGTATRQREYPPYINHDTVPDLPPVKD